MEPIKEIVNIDRCVGREISQVLVEGDIIVPDVKPDMESVLQTDESVYIENFDIVNGRISFKGNLGIELIYISKSGEKPIHSIDFSAPVNDFIIIDGIEKGMLCNLNCDIENIDYKMINDRKVSFRAVLNVIGNVFSSEEESIVADVEEISDNQMIRSNFKLNEIVLKKADRFIIREEIHIPSGKPNIGEVVQCAVQISNKDIRALNGKIGISGELMISTLYKSDMSESVIEFIESEIPFNGSVEASDVKEGMFADAVVSVQDKYVKICPDSDGEDRIIEIEVSVGAFVDVCCEKEIQILEDAYCIDKNLSLSEKVIEYPSFLCRNKSQFPIKEVVSLDDDDAKILQVFKVSGKQHLDEFKILDDKIVVEGIISVDVLYIASDDDVPIHCYKTIIPYRQTIETKGTRENKNVDCDIKVNLDRINLSMLSDREIEIKCMLNFYVCVNENKIVTLIEDICFSDFDKNFFDRFPSMTIYVVKPGDTLWKIAKRFNTTIEDIVAVNDIEDPDKIYPGDKFLVLKKIPQI